MRKSILLSILGVAILPAIKNRSGSSSTLNNVVRSVGSRDGLITFRVQVEYTAPIDYTEYKVYATLGSALKDAVGQYNNLVERMLEIGYSDWPDEFGEIDRIEHLEEQYFDAFAEELPQGYYKMEELQFHPRASLPISKIEVNRRYGLSEKFEMKMEILEAIKEAADADGFEYPENADFEYFMMNVDYEHGFDPYDIKHMAMEEQSAGNHLEFKISFDPHKSPKILTFGYDVFEKLIQDLLNISFAKLGEWYGITEEVCANGEGYMGGTQKVMIHSDIPVSTFPINQHMQQRIRRF